MCTKTQLRSDNSSLGMTLSSLLLGKGCWSRVAKRDPRYSQMGKKPRALHLCQQRTRAVTIALCWAVLGPSLWQGHWGLDHVQRREWSWEGSETWGAAEGYGGFKGGSFYSFQPGEKGEPSHCPQFLWQDFPPTTAELTCSATTWIAHCPPHHEPRPAFLASKLFLFSSGWNSQ